MSKPQGINRDESIAATTESRELAEYEKGYLDGLLEGTRSAGVHKWPMTYKLAAEKYLRSIGLEGWRVNVRHV